MKKLLNLIVAVGLLAYCIPSAKAAPSPTSPTTNIITEASSVTVTNATTLTINGTAIPLYRDRGLAVIPKLVGAGADTGNVTFNFDVSQDNAVWSNTSPLTYVVASNGTNTVRGFKLLSRDLLDNIKYVRLTSITNAATNNVTINSVSWSVFP